VTTDTTFNGRTLADCLTWLQRRRRRDGRTWIEKTTQPATLARHVEKRATHANREAYQ
jgi:hypothetical protein